MKINRLQTYIEDDYLKKIMKTAKENGMTRAAVVRMIIAHYYDMLTVTKTKK